MFEKSNLLLALATRSRAPLASPKGDASRTSRGTRPTQWLGYTDKTHLRGFKTLIFY